MEERSNTRKCDRENDLIAFLYGEANEREARDFERHLKTCLQCESELGAFKPIRQSIIEWREEALGRVRETTQSATNYSRTLASGKRSAMAAFREFFSLSPLWLKGAVAFASILFCVFGSLALARLLNPNDRPVASNDKKLYTHEELTSKIDEAVQAKVEELARQKDQRRTGENSNANDDLKTVQAVVGPSGKSVSPYRMKPASGPLTRTEREQLAADLRLVSPKDEITLDLLGDRLNPPD
ncbi:MAG TPA: zf-HC2 domain-containing protein [Pyrinomonadaceae bacterium]|nr:zf-HC2 domain-containing protein [Pyrinomonadaceae bacterium]